MRLVLIDWVDSYGCSAVWQHLEGATANLMKSRSVGWLLQDDEDCKLIVPHISDSTHPELPQQGCGDMTIPTKAILSITDLQDF